jgi:hypothetical protein
MPLLSTASDGANHYFDLQASIRASPMGFVFVLTETRIFIKRGNNHNPINQELGEFQGEYQ